MYLAIFNGLLITYPIALKISVTIMCQNDELSWMMSLVGCLLPGSELLSYLQKTVKLLSRFMSFLRPFKYLNDLSHSHSLNFDESGSPESVST